MSIIEVDGLAKTFRTRERAAGLAGSLRSFVAPRYREREAVKPISFVLEPAEVLAFIGPNGAGKSTTIKMLTGIIHLYSVLCAALLPGLLPWQHRRFVTAGRRSADLVQHLPDEHLQWRCETAALHSYSGGFRLVCAVAVAAPVHLAIAGCDGWVYNIDCVGGGGYVRVGFATV